jgi:hypothetical protein
MLQQMVETRGAQRSKSKRASPGQQQLPFAFDYRLNQIPDEWHQVALRFRRANGIREAEMGTVLDECVEKIDGSAEEGSAEMRLCCGF